MTLHESNAEISLKLAFVCFTCFKSSQACNFQTLLHICLKYTLGLTVANTWQTLFLLHWILKLNWKFKKCLMLTLTIDLFKYTFCTCKFWWQKWVYFMYFFYSRIFILSRTHFGHTSALDVVSCDSSMRLNDAYSSNVKSAFKQVLIC